MINISYQSRVKIGVLSSTSELIAPGCTNLLFTPTHGHQQLSLFHGYYGHQIYFPVLINEAKSGYPLILQLRAGNSHAGKGVLGLLRWLFWRLKKAWPDVKIILRGDGGFSLPEIINLCERKEVKYVFGFSNNAVLKRKINYLLDLARLEYFRTLQKARLFDDVYYAAKTWKKPRRIVMKALKLPQKLVFLPDEF